MVIINTRDILKSRFCLHFWMVNVDTKINIEGTRKSLIHLRVLWHGFNRTIINGKCGLFFEIQQLGIYQTIAVRLLGSLQYKRTVASKLKLTKTKKTKQKQNKTKKKKKRKKELFWQFLYSGIKKFNRFAFCFPEKKVE